MMRALKAAAAVAVLGVLTGGSCTTSTPGTLSFAWKFADKKGVVAGDFTAANNGCSTAFVDGITVNLDGTDYAGNPCAAPGNQPNGTPGVDILDVPAGNHSYTVSGFRGSELVFQASGSVRSSGVKTAVNVTLAPASTGSSLPIYFTQNGAYSCSGTPQVRYGIVDAYNSPLDSATLACSTTSPYFVPIRPASGNFYPFGPYKLHYLSMVDMYGVAIYQVCCLPIDHEGFAQVINLPAAGVACPASPASCP